MIHYQSGMKYLDQMVVIILLSLLSISCASTGTAKYGLDGQPPNVIFILADDLGYAGLSCYGQTKYQTPCIDALAAQGMRFTQCYAGSNVCAPSRSTLMTGQHTGHTPIRTNQSGTYLHPDDVTVAELFKQAGYTTGCFGKWGLGEENTPGHPNHQGFDEFFGQLHQVHGHFYYPYFLWKNKSKYYLPENEGRKRVRYAHDEIHLQAIDFIRRNKNKPLFCYIPYIIPHAELTVPEDSLKPFRGKFKEEPLAKLPEGHINSDEPFATYAAMITRMDKHVGQIISLLKELGIYDNTLVFFTSDNGGEWATWRRLTKFFNSNGPLKGGKTLFYEGGIRIPMIAHWPGKIKAGSQTDHICAFWDFLPTAAEIIGVTPPKETDGISFLPTLLGKGRQKEHEYLYWEYPHHQGTVKAVRMGDWKMAQHWPNYPLELYNLSSDISETKDLADKHPEIMKKIKDYIKTAHTQERKYPVTPWPRPKDYVR